MSVSTSVPPESPSRPEPGGFRSCLRNRDFLLLWLAQVISQTIQYATNYAVLVLVTDITGLTTYVGLAIISFSIPAVIFGAPAGAIVDRMKKRRVLWLSNLIRAIASLGFVGSLTFFPHTVWPVFALIFFVSSVGQFFTPAEGTAIPLLVKPEELLSALSLFNLTLTFSQAAGLVILGPLLLKLLGVRGLFIVIALLYGICTLLIIALPRSKIGLSPQKRLFVDGANLLHSIWKDVRESWHFIRCDRILTIAVTQLSVAGIMILVLSELSTSFVKQYFNLPASDAALILAPSGIGLALGSFFVPKVVRRWGKIRTANVGLLALGGIIALLWVANTFGNLYTHHHWVGSAPAYLIVLLLVFCLGGALDLINIPAQTTIQERSPDEIKGRVLAMQLMLYNTATILPLLFIGTLADTLGISGVMLVVAALLFGLSSASFYITRKGTPFCEEGQHYQFLRKEERRGQHL